MSKSSHQRSKDVLAALRRQIDALEGAAPLPPPVVLSPDEFMVAAYEDAGRRAVAYVAGLPERDPKS